MIHLTTVISSNSTVNKRRDKQKNASHRSIFNQHFFNTFFFSFLIYNLKKKVCENKVDINSKKKLLVERHLLGICRSIKRLQNQSKNNEVLIDMRQEYINLIK